VNDTASGAAPEGPGAGAPGRTRRLLAVLPVVILLGLIGGALGVVADLDGPASTEPTIGPSRPSVPLLSLRRDLGPLAEEAADRRLLVALEGFAAAMPADTCLTVTIGDLRFAHRADDPQVPASAQKLLVATAALLALGPDFRHVTTVTTPTPPAGGIVAGDLHLVGGGDPLLAQGEYAARYRRPQPFSDLRVLADAVVAAGVTRVDGALVGDDSRYDPVRYHPAWPPRFITQDQTGPLSALAVNDGFATWPASGSSPLVPAPDPAALGAEVLRLLLEERGVVVAGGARSGPAPVDAPVVARHESLPLRDVVAQMLAESDNATAELLLKELGLQVAGAGTFEAGARAVTQVLAEAGFPMDGVAVVDGSGLASQNVVDCDLLDQLLAHRPTADAIRDGLAVAGESGTLAGRWVDTILAGQVRAKTGTLNQVTSLSGFARTASGDDARFTLVVNVPEPQRIQRETFLAQERLTALLVQHPDRPDLSGLGVS